MIVTLSGHSCHFWEISLPVSFKRQEVEYNIYKVKQIAKKALSILKARIHTCLYNI